MNSYFTQTLDTKMKEYIVNTKSHYLASYDIPNSEIKGGYSYTLQRELHIYIPSDPSPPSKPQSQSSSSSIYLQIKSHIIYQDYCNRMSQLANQILTRLFKILKLPIHWNEIFPRRETLSLIQYKSNNDNNNNTNIKFDPLLKLHTDWGYITLIATEESGLEIFDAST